MKKILSNLLCVSVLFFSCENTSSDESKSPDLQYTTAEQNEAYNLSLWYDGTLEPSVQSIEKHILNLKQIRTTFSDSIEAVKITFESAWVHKMLLVQWDSLTAAQIQNKTYSGWDNLETKYQPIDSTRTADLFRWSSLRFEKSYNPYALGKLFEQKLPGVVLFEPNVIIPGEFSSMLIPVLNTGVNGYYFYKRILGIETGDYFEIRNNKVVHVGSFNSSNGIKPDWYTNVNQMKNEFGRFQGYNATIN